VSVAEAEAMLRRREINGFSIGQFMTAKRDTLLKHGQRVIPVAKGRTVLASTFARGQFGTLIRGNDFTGSRRDFEAGREVVLELH